MGRYQGYDHQSSLLDKKLEQKRCRAARGTDDVTGPGVDQ